ncbi:uncharacterized protein [Coffea arabica]|uniref:RNase H type-1 domain-containing protein n=1 Tax=Coffea arabica TaxID=13443 RepID=A0ABM4W8C8_COFAR
MHKKYIKGTHPSIAAVDRPPASWRRLLVVREFAESQIRWCLGKGFVDFWYDAWCGDLPLALELGMSDPPHFLVGEFFTSQGWNVPRLREWVPEAVVQRIATIFFSPEQDDVMVWVPSPNGDFSVSSAWESRNLARFQAGIFTPTQVISQIEEFLGQMGRARAFARPSFAGDWDCPWASLCNPTRRDMGTMLVSWEKPPTGWLKLNSDASVINGKAAGGGVLRDHWGRVVWAYYKEFGDLDVLAAEAQSLLFSLQLCVERGVSSLIVESDSRVLVQLVGSKALSKWPLCTVLREITHHIGRLEATLLHVFREANAVADALASLQLGEHRLFESLTALPSKARGEARLDCHGVPRIRTGRC